MKNRNMADSFNNAISGIIHTIKSEKNMKFHMIAAITVLVMSLVFHISRLELIIVLLMIAVVIACEMFNTAIERVTDVLFKEYNPNAKIIKDTAAGGVLVSAFISCIVGYFIFFDKVSKSLVEGIVILKQAPMNIMVIALVLNVIVVFSIKAFLKKGKPLSGGMPSGHAAVATSVTTVIALITYDEKITVLCMLLSVLVIQTRYEAKIHTLKELLAGSIIGFFITMIMFKIFM